MGIKDAREIMEEYDCDYWEAFKFAEAYDYGDDEHVFFVYGLKKVFALSIEDNQALYIKVINDMFTNIINNDNIDKSILTDTGYREVCECSECGGLICDDFNTSTNFEMAEEVFKKLITMTDGYIDIRKGIDPFTDKMVYHVSITKHTEHTKAVCEECEKISDFFYDDRGNYKEGNIDKIFDCKIWSHGLSTGYKKNLSNSYDEIIGSMKNFSPEWQICCSDKSQRIGSFGFYIMGHAQYVSTVDLWSYINDRGDRVFPIDICHLQGLVDSPVAYSLDEWDHTEVIVTHTKIVGIWFKDWFIRHSFAMRAYKAVCKVAKKNKVPVYIVKGRRG